MTQAGMSKHKILLVEDDQGLNKLIQTKLERRNFLVEGCHNGAKAVKLLEANDYELLILDYQLSDMNAIELVTKLDFYIPFIIITGRGDEKTAVEMMKLGAVDYLIKRPNFIDLLPEVVNRTIKELNRELELQKAYQKLKSERERKNKALRRLKKLKQAVEQSSSIILITDQQGKIEYVNPRFEKVTGYKLSEVRGENPNVLKSGHTAADKYKELWHKITSGQEWRGEFYNQKKNGNFYWELASIAPIKNKADEIIGFVKTAEDISARKAKEAEIEYITYHDGLTNLYNRKYYEKKLDELDTKSNLPLSLIIGDLNGLKLANDVFGHEVGDELLKETAAILRKSVRDNDIIARWGGDEFGIILPQTNEEEVMKVRNRIKESCTNSQFEPLPPFIALGNATKNTPEENLKKVFKESEDRMYQDKQQQKNSADNPLLNKIINDLEETNYIIVDSIIKMLFCQKRQSKLNLSEHELEALFLLARFHDLGKLVIDDKILNKNQVLTASEWQKYKRHPEIAYDIAKNFEKLKPIANYILSHHEHWDGSGYPEGLKGNDIPLLARIIHILDFYAGVTDEQFYPVTKNLYYVKPLSKKEAVTEIKKYKGSFFDPELVEIITTILLSNNQCE